MNVPNDKTHELFLADEILSDGSIDGPDADELREATTAIHNALDRAGCIYHERRLTILYEAERIDWRIVGSAWKPKAAADPPSITTYIIASAETAKEHARSAGWEAVGFSHWRDDFGNLFVRLVHPELQLLSVCGPARGGNTAILDLGGLDAPYVHPGLLLSRGFEAGR